MKQRKNFVEDCVIKSYSQTLKFELMIVHEVVETMNFALQIEDRQILKIAREICTAAKAFTLSQISIDEKICRIIDQVYELNNNLEDVKTVFLNSFEEINVKVNQFFKTLYLGRPEYVQQYLKKKHRKVTNAIKSCKFLILQIVNYYVEETEMQ